MERDGTGGEECYNQINSLLFLRYSKDSVLNITLSSFDANVQACQTATNQVRLRQGLGLRSNLTVQVAPTLKPLPTRHFLDDRILTRAIMQIDFEWASNSRFT